MNHELEETQEKKLVIACVEDHTKAMVLFRAAHERAAEIQGRWKAVFADAISKDSVAHERIHNLLALATKMGGEAYEITTNNLKQAAAEIIDKEHHNIALLITEPTIKTIRLRSTLSGALERHAARYDIPVGHINVSDSSYKKNLLQEKLGRFWLLNILYAIIAVAIASAFAFFLRETLPPALFKINNQNVGLLFMIACAFSAGRFGLIPGLVASLTSVFIINWFFTLPYYQYTIGSITDVLNMGIFLSATILISIFTSNTRGAAEKASKRELSMRVLFNLYRVASDASTRLQTLEKLHNHLAGALNMEVAFFMPPLFSPEKIDLAYPYNVALNDTDKKALEICWKETKPTGVGSSIQRNSLWRFKPMLAKSGIIGVIAVKPYFPEQIDSWFREMLMAIADQAAAIIEHVDIASTSESARIDEEREKLRSMLLSSVSHDLKTPLASIIGALGIYRRHASRLDATNRSALIETALGEAERLDSLITNILDMTKLESKRIKFKQNWYEPHLVIQEVLKRMNYRLRNHTVIVKPFTQKIEVYLDYMMTGQVLQNIIDNACKYSPSGTVIELQMVATEGGGFSYEVRDHGSGIPPEKMTHIFDKYARLQMRDSQVAGTGLGLSICKSIAESQGGSIDVANHPEGGAIFTLNLPSWRVYDMFSLQTG